MTASSRVLLNPETRTRFEIHGARQNHPHVQPSPQTRACDEAAPVITECGSGRYAQAPVFLPVRDGARPEDGWPARQAGAIVAVALDEWPEWRGVRIGNWLPRRFGIR